MQVKYLTHEAIAYLRSEGISFYHLPGDIKVDSSLLYDRSTTGFRMNDHMYGKMGVVPGDAICYLPSAQISKMSGFHLKRVSDERYIDMHDIGYMSFSASNLGLDTQVGRYCSLSWNIKIIQFDHPVYTISSHPFTYSNQYDFDLNYLSVVFSNKQEMDAQRVLCANPQKDKLVIGHDVWIGADAALRKGITIGTGAVVAGNSVVTKNVEPYCIVGGNPAKVIKKRFDDSLIKELLASEWWEYNYLDFCDLPLHNPAAFVKQFELRKKSIKRFNPGFLDLSKIP